jgi:hypothetical protein
MNAQLQPRAEEAPKFLVQVSVPMPVTLTPEFLTKLEDATAKIEATSIASNEEYVSAADWLKVVKGYANDVEADRGAAVAPINKAHDKVQGQYKPHQTLLKRLESLLKSKLLAWDEAQDQLRKAEQAKLEEAARQQREELEAKAREEQRKATEKAEADRKAAEAAAAAGDAKKAAKLQERADATLSAAAYKAESLNTSAAMIVAPVIQREVPKVAGLAKKKKWKFKVKDESKVGRLYLMLDEKKIAKIVETLGKDAEQTVGGIEVFQDSSLASGSV